MKKLLMSVCVVAMFASCAKEDLCTAWVYGVHYTVLHTTIKESGKTAIDTIGRDEVGPICSEMVIYGISKHTYDTLHTYHRDTIKVIEKFCYFNK